MNQGYSQSNKKGSMAAKMVTKYAMNGKTSGYGGGMKYEGNGKKDGHPGGMKPKMHGKDEGYAKGEKPTQVNKKYSFSKNYTQANKDRE